MLDHLFATGVHPDLPESLDLYGPLIGSWDIQGRLLDDTTGQWQEMTPRWEFARILGGLGIQDVLYGRTGAGTTVRVYDKQLGSWRVAWFGPTFDNYATLVARPEGDTIFQEGTGTDGRPLRWTFQDITPDSFSWTGHISDDGGVTWRVEQEMWGKRRR